MLAKAAGAKSDFWDFFFLKEQLIFGLLNIVQLSTSITENFQYEHHSNLVLIFFHRVAFILRVIIFILGNIPTLLTNKRWK